MDFFFEPTPAGDLEVNGNGRGFPQNSTKLNINGEMTPPVEERFKVSGLYD